MSVEKKDGMPYPSLIYETDGLISDHEREALYDLATSIPSGIITEIGSWKGASTVCLALGALTRATNTIYAIDPHVANTYWEFLKNLRHAGVDEFVRPIVATSKQAHIRWSLGPIMLLFVDGAHDHDNVQFDFTAWVDLVAPGGIICVHDWLVFKTVTNAVRRHLLLSRRLLPIATEESLIVFRNKPASLRRRILSILLSYAVNLFPRFPWLSPLYGRIRALINRSRRFASLPHK
jgi:predicted O-methyltransferase YrrM